MRLENVLAVTGGRLLNTPSISRFEEISLMPHKTKRGSIFLARSLDEIIAAVNNGAYGIIVDKEVTPIDTEIAWIVVEDISLALLKLLKLWLMANNRRFYLIDPIEFEYAKLVTVEQSVIFLNDNIFNSAEKILSSKERDTIFHFDKTFFKHIGVYPLKTEGEIDYFLVKSTTFLVTALIENRYYNDLNVCKALFKLFINTIGALKALEISYNIKNLEYTPYCKPVFVDNLLKEVEFGKSDRVIIFTSSFLGQNFYKEFEKIKWINTKVLVPKNIKLEYDIRLPVIEYQCNSELLSIIEKELKKPSYILLVDKKKETFFNFIKNYEKNEVTSTLKGLF